MRQMRIKIFNTNYELLNDNRKGNPLLELEKEINVFIGKMNAFDIIDISIKPYFDSDSYKKYISRYINYLGVVKYYLPINHEV